MADFNLVPVDHDPFETAMAGLPQRPSGTQQWQSAIEEQRQRDLRKPSMGEQVLGIVGRTGEMMAAPLTNLAQRMGEAYEGGIDWSDPAAVGQMGGKTVQDMLTLGAPGIAAAERGAVGAFGGKPITAYHGSPHDFDKFDLSKIGTGEGNQAYGHGLYFAENEGVARQYRDALSTRQNVDDPVARAQFWASMKGGREGGIKWLESVLSDAKKSPRNFDPEDLEKTRQAVDYLKSGGELNSAYGKLYQVSIKADPEHFLDWDKPLSEQSEHIQKAVAGKTFLGGQRDILDAAGYGKSKVSKSGGDWYVTDGRTGETFRTDPNTREAAQEYALRGDNENRQRAFTELIRTPETAERLQKAGIPGIKYLDQGSRSAGEGSRNYVVFDDKLIDILKKYGLAGLIAGGAYHYRDEDLKQ